MLTIRPPAHQSNAEHDQGRDKVSSRCRDIEGSGLERDIGETSSLASPSGKGTVSTKEVALLKATVESLRSQLREKQDAAAKLVSKSPTTLGIHSRPATKTLSRNTRNMRPRLPRAWIDAPITNRNVSVTYVSEHPLYMAAVRQLQCYRIDARTRLEDLLIRQDAAISR